MYIYFLLPLCAGADGVRCVGVDSNGSNDYLECGCVVEESSQRMRVYKCPRLATNGVRCCVFACAAAFARFYVRMLNRLASLAASDSLICADSFVIGVLDDECGGGGGCTRQHSHTEWRR